jgi:hypothetical protein
MTKMRFSLILAALCLVWALAVPAAAQDAPWTDDLVKSLVARDAAAFTEGVAARMPDSYASVKQQVLGTTAGLGQLLNGLAPTHADPAGERAPVTASLRCRSYLIHGSGPFAVVFHLYRPQGDWQLLAFNLKQLAPENFPSYVRQMCEERPIPEK